MENKTLHEQMQEHHNLELKSIFRFIDKRATLEDCARIIEEIRCVHDNLIAWNEDVKLLLEIESVGINGECIQLNIGKGR